MAPFRRKSKVGNRKLRKPTTNYHLLKQRPWQIQPFFIAPVLPGETFKNALWKQTSITDPVPNRLIGWWQETHLFYVRIRDLFPGEDLKTLFIDAERNLSSLYSAADPKYFHYYGVNWVKEAVRLIVEHYFRAEDEAPDDHTIDGMWAVSAGTDNWLDSAINADDLAEATDVDVTGAVSGAVATIAVSDIEKAKRTYELLKAGALTDMDYEDFLRTYGIRLPQAEQEGKPRHLRGIKSWAMPVNTVEPTTGVATTAVYWKLDQRHDTDMLFKEPGFLIGLQVFKPKVYLGNQKGSLVGIMDTAMEWLPAIMRDDPTSSMVQLPNNASPLSGITDDIAVDIRDLFLYGEQFVNFATNTEDQNMVALPTAAMQKRYPSLTDAKEMFVDDAADGTKQFIETDGRIDISILGHETDATPSVARLV